MEDLLSLMKRPCKCGTRVSSFGYVAQCGLAVRFPILMRIRAQFVPNDPMTAYSVRVDFDCMNLLQSSMSYNFVRRMNQWETSSCPTGDSRET